MDVKTVRLLHLRAYIEKDFGGNASQCADALGIKRPQLSRWITANDAARQGISEESARAIEARLGKPHGAMDRMPEGLDAQKSDADVIEEFTWLWSSFNDAGRNFLKDMLRSAASQALFFKKPSKGQKP